jgi:hypothetical protein
MDETFDLLRRAAEQRRETIRRLHGGLDPAAWEALLDRVEDQLEEDDRDEAAVPERSPSSRHTGLTLSLLI